METGGSRGWVNEIALGVWLFTRNHDGPFGLTKTQDPLGSPPDRRYSSSRWRWRIRISSAIPSSLWCDPCPEGTIFSLASPLRDELE
jgi:hypothetical protein